jgi:hypothetical protein
MEAFHFIYLITGIFVGATAAWFIAKSKFTQTDKGNLLNKTLEMNVEVEKR